MRRRSLMTAVLVFLVLLLLAALGGLAFLGFHAIQLRFKVTQLDLDLAAQRDRYDQDHKQWNDESINVKGQYQGLVKKYNENSKRWNESSTALNAEIQRLA